MITKTDSPSSVCPNFVLGQILRRSRLCLMKPLLHMWWVTLLAQRMDMYFLVVDDDADHDVVVVM